MAEQIGTMLIAEEMAEPVSATESQGSVLLEPCAELALGSPVQTLAAQQTINDFARPRLYYGWYMLLLAMVFAIASSPGQTFAVSIFIESMRVDLGLTHSQIGMAYTLGTILGAGPILWIGHQMDRHGLRRTALVVSVVFGLACCLMGVVYSWVQIVIAFTLLRMLGPGALCLISTNILPFWFSNKLGTVEGLRQTAMAVAMAVTPLLNLWLVNQFGWRIAYELLGLVIVGILGPLVWRYLRSGPAELGLMIDGHRSEKRHPDQKRQLVQKHCQVESKGVAGSSCLNSELTAAPAEHSVVGMNLTQTIRTRAFWIVLAGTSLFGMIQTGLFFCLTPIVEEFGMSASMAATILAVFAVSLACHQLMGGRLADLLKPKWQLALGMSLFVAGLTCLLVGRTPALAIGSGILLGAAQGTYFSAAQPLWARYYGLTHLGKLRGLLMASNVALSSLGPLLVGVCFDLYGSFTPALLLFVFLPLPLALASLFVEPPSNRLGEVGSQA